MVRLISGRVGDDWPPTRHRTIRGHDDNGDKGVTIRGGCGRPFDRELLLARKSAGYTGDVGADLPQLFRGAPELQNLMAAWMSGYFNAARNMPTVDFGRHATNKRLVAEHCRAHRDENLMRAIETVAF